MKKRSINRIVVIGYSVALSCLFYFLWITYQNLHSTSQDSREFTTSLQLQQATEAVFSDIRDVETGARGFIISGREEYLKPYYSGKSRIDNDLELLKRKFSVGESADDNRKLYFLVLERLKRSDEQVKMRRNKGMQSAIETVHSGRGAQVMDSIRSVVRRIQTGCLHRLSKSNQDKKLMAKNTLQLFLTSGGLVIAFLSFSCILLIRAFRKKSSYEKQVDYLNGIAENIHDAIVFTDIGFIITDWNEGASKMFDYRPEEAIGKSTMAILKSNFLFEKRLLITNEIFMHGFWKGEVISHRRNNEEVVGLVTATAMEANGGELGGFIFLIRDITWQTVTGEKLSVVLESSTDSILLVNDKGHIESSNANAEEFFGFSKDELNKRTSEDIFPGILQVMQKHFELLNTNPSRIHTVSLTTNCRKNNTLLFPLEVVLVFFKTIRGGYFYIRTQSYPEKVLDDYKSMLNPQPEV